MMGFFRAVVLTLPLATAAFAAPQTPAIRHAAEMCKPEGGFGREFAGSAYGHADTTADAEWAPFERLTIAGNAITAVADFHGRHDTRAEDVAAAQHFLKELEKAVADTHRFPHRQGGVFRTAGGQNGGLVLELRLDGDHVVARCINLGT